LEKGKKENSKEKFRDKDVDVGEEFTCDQ